jgi:hypothetical protein
VLRVRDDWKKKGDWGFDWRPWFRGDRNSKSAPRYSPRFISKAKIGKLLYDEQEMRLDFRGCGMELVTEWQPQDPVGMVFRTLRPRVCWTGRTVPCLEFILPWKTARANENARQCACLTLDG